MIEIANAFCRKMVTRMENIYYPRVMKKGNEDKISEPTWNEIGKQTMGDAWSRLQALSSPWNKRPKRGPYKLQAQKTKTASDVRKGGAK